MHYPVQENKQKLFTVNSLSAKHCEVKNEKEHDEIKPAGDPSIFYLCPMDLWI